MRQRDPFERVAERTDRLRRLAPSRDTGALLRATSVPYLIWLAVFVLHYRGQGGFDGSIVGSIVLALHALAFGMASLFVGTLLWVWLIERSEARVK